MLKEDIRRSALPLALFGAAALSGCVSPGVTAAVHRDAPGLERVLDRPDHGGEDLDNVLSNAIAFDCGECARLLLKAGAKPGSEALAAAAVEGREEIARLLVGAGADPAAAMALIHARTRKWAGAAGLSPQQSQGASDLFRKLERERAAAAGPAPAVATIPAAAPAAAAKEAGPRIAPAFREEARVDDYALVVGVGDYETLPAAAYARRDAESAADFFKALGVPASNMVTLLGARATRTAVAKNLEGWLADNADANSTVYFYFSGRGAVDPKSKRDCLVPFDGDARYLEQTAYPLKRLYETLDGLKIKRAVVVLDADFSGSGGRSISAEGAEPAPGAVEAGFNSANGRVALLAAADGDRAAGTSAEAGHGLFSRALFEGLNGAAGTLTLKSLFDGAKQAVVEAARRDDRVQVPLFVSGGAATDDVVLRAGRP